MNSILHVTEAYNGGVVKAIESTITSTPNFKHFLLAKSHEYDPLPNQPNSTESVEIIAWNGKNVFALAFNLRRIKNQLKPDLIHSHSSWAGLLCRLIFSRKLNIYSSHGFGFQKKDINVIFRSAIYIVESLLLLKTSVIFCYWPYEKKLAKTLLGPKTLRLCPLMMNNRSNLDTIYSNKNEYPNKKIITIGRITRAKDPEYFIRAKESISKTNQNIEFIWIGDGDYEEKKNLTNAGVAITGWLGKEDLKRELSSADLAMFTSEWEAGPATLYESLENNVPVCLRNFPATIGLGLPIADSPEALGQMAIDILREDKSITLFKQRESLENYMSQNRGVCAEQIYYEQLSKLKSKEC